MSYSYRSGIESASRHLNHRLSSDDSIQTSGTYLESGPNAILRGSSFSLFLGLADQAFPGP